MWCLQDTVWNKACTRNTHFAKKTVFLCVISKDSNFFSFRSYTEKFKPIRDDIWHFQIVLWNFTFLLRRFTKVSRFNKILESDTWKPKIMTLYRLVSLNRSTVHYRIPDFTNEKIIRFSGFHVSLQYLIESRNFREPCVKIK